MDKESELQIIEAVLSGKTSSFEQLINHYKDFVFSLVLKIVRKREDAEEVSQDVFIKAFNSLSNFKGESKFSTWLYRIAYTTAISSTRKKYDYNNQVVSDVDEQRQVEYHPVDNVVAEQRSKYIQRALDSLGSKEKTAIMLYYFEQQTVKEMATILGESVSNIKIKLYRARKKLHEELKLLLGTEINELL